MSYTEMFACGKSGKMRIHKEFRNSHHFFMIIWETMYREYYAQNVPTPSWVTRMNYPPDYKPSFMSLDGDLLKGFWKVAYDESIPENHRLVLQSTYDNCIIRRERFLDYADCLLSFVDDFKEKVEHYFGQIIEISEEVRSLVKSRKHAIAFATSINGDSYHHTGPLGGVIYHNVFTEDRYWLLFEDE